MTHPSRRTHPAPRGRLLAAAGALLAATAAPVQAQTAVFWEPTPYLSAADIPAGFYQGNSPAFLDTLEDGALDGGLSANAGNVIGPGQFDGLRDSVDADDGAIDGSGLTGRSFFSGNGAAGFTFTFSGPVLPTAFALVLTDMAGANATFSAFDANGASLGSITRSGFADGNFAGGTAEDRFFGLQYAGGIQSIHIQQNGGGGIEVDHLQYGSMAAAVPEPATWLSLAAGLGLLALRRVRAAGRREGG